MSQVIDAGVHEPEQQVDRNHHKKVAQTTTPPTPKLLAISRKVDGNGANQAKDGRRGPRRDLVAAQKAEHKATNARQQVEAQKAPAAKSSLNVKAQDPERIAIERQMDDADVQKASRQQAPVLPRNNQGIILGAEQHQDIGVRRATHQGHGQKDEAVERQQQIGQVGLVNG